MYSCFIKIHHSVGVISLGITLNLEENFPHLDHIIQQSCVWSHANKHQHFSGHLLLKDSKDVPHTTILFPSKSVHKQCTPSIRSTANMAYPVKCLLSWYKLNHGYHLCISSKALSTAVLSNNACVILFEDASIAAIFFKQIFHLFAKFLSRSAFVLCILWMLRLMRSSTEL